MPMTPNEIDKAAADTERWLGEVDPADLEWDDPADLRAIAEAQDRIARAEAELVEAVAAARVSSRSWAEIGRALGVSRQAAHERFGAALLAEKAG